jgi:predicted alpha/beta-fold hydrolase
MPAASAVSLSKSLIGSKLYVPSFLSTMKAKALAANDGITSSDNNSNSNNSSTSNDKHVSSNSIYLHGKSPELKPKSAAAAAVDFEALKAVSSIDEFNRIYTVPEFGFQNTTEYVSFASHCLYLLYTACGT